MKVAWLSAGNGVGFEIFEFIDPKFHQPQPPSTAAADDDLGFDYSRGGFFHIAVTAPDPAALLEKVVKAGGRQIGETIDVYEDSALYFQDPWGNVVEVVSCSFEMLMGNRE